jgi:excisionase family DNA binding protein
MLYDCDIMTAQEVAEYLRIDQRTVTAHAMGGVIPGRQFGKLWRFSRRAILALVYDPQNAQALSKRDLGADGDGVRSNLVHTLHPANRPTPAPAHRPQDPVPHQGKGFKSGPTASRDVQ